MQLRLYTIVHRVYWTQDDIDNDEAFEHLYAVVSPSAHQAIEHAYAEACGEVEDDGNRPLRVQFAQCVDEGFNIDHAIIVLPKLPEKSDR